MGTFASRDYILLKAIGANIQGLQSAEIDVSKTEIFYNFIVRERLRTITNDYERKMRTN